MSKRYRNIPGFPGDGDSSIDLKHAAPIHWTTKMTIWSLVMFVILAALAAVVFMAADGKGMLG